MIETGKELAAAVKLPVPARARKRSMSEKENIEHLQDISILLYYTLFIARKSICFCAAGLGKKGHGSLFGRYNPLNLSPCTFIMSLACHIEKCAVRP